MNLLCPKLFSKQAMVGRAKYGRGSEFFSYNLIFMLASRRHQNGCPLSNLENNTQQ
jgi:hypothetical protein